MICTMDDVRVNLLGLSHNTSPAAVMIYQNKKNKSLKFNAITYKNGDGSYRTVLNNKLNARKENRPQFRKFNQCK